MSIKKDKMICSIKLSRDRHGEISIFIKSKILKDYFAKVKLDTKTISNSDNSLVDFYVLPTGKIGTLVNTQYNTSFINNLNLSGYDNARPNGALLLSSKLDIGQEYRFTRPIALSFLKSWIIDLQNMINQIYAEYIQEYSEYIEITRKQRIEA